MLLGIAELALGVGALAYSGWIVAEGVAAARWPTVPGRITEARVERVLGDKWGGHRWEPRVAYSYQVNDQSYTGSRLSFSDESTYKDWAIAKTGRYVVGTSVAVRYNPTDPARSVLEPGFRWGSLTVGVVGLLFLAAALATLGLW